MGRCGRLALTLDEDMLVLHGIPLSDSRTPLSQLPVKSGIQVASEIGHRYLIRYVHPGEYEEWGTAELSKRLASRTSTFVTPTPFCADEATEWLNLPDQRTPRSYAVLFRPNAITEIRGPRINRIGRGIEYIIEGAIPLNAIVDMGSESDTRWLLRLS